METWALIYNPTSGNFRPRVLDNVARTLHGAGIATRLLPTAYPRHATELAAAAHGVERVAVYGGDGTLNEAANGLVGRELPLVFLPGGTANVMAWEIGLTVDPVGAALAQARSRARPMWPGRIDDRYFLLMAGFGYDGRTVRRVTPRLKGWLGKAAYVLSGLIALGERNPPLRVHTGNGADAVGNWVVVARARHYGGRFAIHPTAGLQQRRLGLVVVRTGQFIPFLALDVGLGWRRDRHAAAVTEHDSLRIECDETIAVQVDGDFHGEGRSFEVGIAPKPLLICFPWGGSGALAR